MIFEGTQKVIETLAEGFVIIHQDIKLIILFYTIILGLPIAIIFTEVILPKIRTIIERKIKKKWDL